MFKGKRLASSTAFGHSENETHRPEGNTASSFGQVLVALLSNLSSTPGRSRHDPVRTILAGLDVVVRQKSLGAPSSAVILCHGFGAPGDDLVALFEALVAMEPGLNSTRFYFPAAPISLGSVGGFGIGGDSRAWWMINVPSFIHLAAAPPEEASAFRKTDPPGMAPARATFRKLVNEVAETTSLPLGRIALGGFSQGAMLATDTALRLEEPCAGLVILSGTLLLEDVWRSKARARSGLPVFMSHGRQDPLLGYGAAQALAHLLSESGLAVEFHGFEGGHTIAPDAVAKLSAFLARVLKP